jgi:hypothetical protein
MFAATVVSDLFDDEGFGKFQRNPVALRDTIQLFIDGANAGVRKYRDNGFSSGVRAAYDHLGLTIGALERCVNDYDLLVMQMAYHEVGHAYIHQITRGPSPKIIERSSFELIADLVATSWFYTKTIRNTPDSEEYRHFRGMSSYAETIFSNSLIALRSQQALLTLMALAGAQRSGGVVSLAVGPIHPPGMQRYLLQHMLLHTLIASNCVSVLSEGHLQQLQDDWNAKMDVLLQSGIVPLVDVEKMLDPAECDTNEVAANLMEEFKVPELQKMVPTLRSIRDLLAGAARTN